MRKLFALLAVIGGFYWGTMTPASAALQGSSVQVCVANGDGTYSKLSVVLTDAYVASTVGGYRNGGPDIIAPFTYSDEYTELNVPGQNWLVKKVVTYRYYYNRVWHTVTTTLWVANTVNQAIYNNGCVAPA